MDGLTNTDMLKEYFDYAQITMYVIYSDQFTLNS